MKYLEAGSRRQEAGGSEGWGKSQIFNLKSSIFNAFSSTPNLSLPE
jgi:hypothetical protein